MKMKLGLFFLFAFVVGSAMSQCLNVQTCVPLGGNCSSPYAVCFGDSFCNSQSVCVALQPIGQNCSGPNSQCQGADIGNSLCWNGTCQSITLNGAVGEPCSNVAQCNNGLFCNNTFGNFYSTGFCITPATQGQNCSDAIECGAGLICNLGTCITRYSVPVGGACGQPFEYSLLVPACAPGLFCLWNTTLGNGTCAQGFASSLAPCNSTVPCANPLEACTCGTATGGGQVCTAPTTTSQSKGNDYNTLEKCAIQNNCNALDPSCCSSDKCIVYDIFYHNNGEVLSFCGNTNPYDSCGKRTWDDLNEKEKIGIIVGVVAFVLIVAGVVAVCCRRRHHHHHHYDKI